MGQADCVPRGMEQREDLAWHPPDMTREGQTGKTPELWWLWSLCLALLGLSSSVAKSHRGQCRDNLVLFFSTGWLVGCTEMGFPCCPTLSMGPSC